MYSENRSLPCRILTAVDVVSMEGAGDDEPPPPKSTRTPLGESTNGQNDRTATRSSSGFAEPGEVAGEASEAIMLPHRCRWARTYSAASYLVGLDHAGNGSSSLEGAANETQ